MCREKFLQLLYHVLEVACQEVESTLAKPVAREFVVILHGAGYTNWKTTLNEAVEILYLGEDQFYRVIDVAITGVAPNATRVFIRASNHTPTTFAQTWNIPVGYGPFKILVANQVEVLEHL